MPSHVLATYLMIQKSYIFIFSLATFDASAKYIVMITGDEDASFGFNLRFDELVAVVVNVILCVGVVATGKVFLLSIFLLPV